MKIGNLKLGRRIHVQLGKAFNLIGIDYDSIVIKIMSEEDGDVMTDR